MDALNAILIIGGGFGAVWLFGKFIESAQRQPREEAERVKQVTVKLEKALDEIARWRIRNPDQSDDKTVEAIIEYASRKVNAYRNGGLLEHTD